MLSMGLERNTSLTLLDVSSLDILKEFLLMNKNFNWKNTKAMELAEMD